VTDKTISLAARSNTSAMAETLAAAFMTDPPLSWILPDAQSRQRRLTHFFKPMVAGAIANGIALRSVQDEAITLWRTPDKLQPGLVETLGGLPNLLRGLGSGLKRALAVSKSLHDHAPHDFPYYYLQFAGVAPASQGKGWGGAAIRAGLERAQAANMPVYLETGTEANVALYKNLGFVIVDEWDVPGGGPHFWGMVGK
jgi:GNAT superfamily N-acetyltransferase